jgi:hypothetical protein
MNTGVLIFAYNNEHLDYLALANWSAKNIRRHLNLPVAVVTDIPVPRDYYFEQSIYAPAEGTSTRRFEDVGQAVTWHNGNRTDAYALSPWTQTLVLDADYVVASDQLKTLLDIKQDFLAPRLAYDVTGKANFDELNYYGRYKMPMSWATVMMFRRSPTAQSIFECMVMIKANWNHYRNLYGIGKSTYRNDFALSIAMSIVDGHTLTTPAVPWKLATVTHDHKLTQVTADEYRVDYVTASGKPQWLRLDRMDFHAMGKKHLGDIVANPC